MKRRDFLSAIAALPFVGLVKPEPNPIALFPHQKEFLDSIGRPDGWGYDKPAYGHQAPVMIDIKGYFAQRPYVVFELPAPRSSLVTWGRSADFIGVEV